jgi:hypothetical protein
MRSDAIQDGKTLHLARTFRARTVESGVALLISLFALLLICVVGIALIMASGTDSALTGNYHSATSVYYAALAGLEEGRGRMLAKSANYLPTALALPAGSLPGPGQVWYILNPLPGETVAPWNQGTATTYPDTEYAQEFGVPPPTSAPAMQSTNSVYVPPTTQQVLPGPIYKWVRINTVTVGSEQANGVMVNPNVALASTPVLYANSHLYADPVPGGVQALEITSLAAMPNGSQRMLQYVVAPLTLGLAFPAALTLDGNNVSFTGSTGFSVTGIDSQSNNPVAAPNCTPVAPPVAAIGYTNNTDASQANIVAGIPPPPSNVNSYTGLGGATPNVQPVSVPANWQTPSALNALVQAIAQNADVNVPAANTPADPSVFPAGMSATNPATIVVNGDLTVRNWAQTGYGILVVTGNLDFGPHDSWDGIVLVIGKGTLTATSNGNGTFYGAVLLANTQGGGANLGAASALMTSGSNNIYYSSCWINFVQSPMTNKVLSFREIPQP